MIGDPIALFVLPTIVRMSAVVPIRSRCCQHTRLGIKRIRRLQPASYVTQAFPDQTRNNFGGAGCCAELSPIDHGMPRLIPDLGLVNVSIKDWDQPATVIVTDRIFDLNDHQLTLGHSSEGLW